MRDPAAYFRGKRITVMGLGLLGRGVGDAAYLAACGAELIVTDLRTQEELRPSLERLAPFSRIQFVLGRHRLEDFRDRDLILKGAAVPPDSPYIAEAVRAGIPVRMSADLFAELSGATIVGVTGTRGKTSTTVLIKSVLDAAGIPALLGGNIHGVSTLSMLTDFVPGQIAVLELDSWQLRGFRQQRMSPHIAVFTTFFPDHLSYYKDNIDAYLADKAALFQHQTEKDVLIIGEQAAPIVQRGYPHVMSRAVVACGEDIEGWELPVPGAHYAANAACARQAARALGVSDAVIRSAFASAPAVPGRLESLGMLRGVQVYNDGAAIIPPATCAALKAMADRSLVVIMGGNDKGVDVDELVAEIRSAAVRRLVFLPGSGTDRIRAYFPDAPVYEHLSDAVTDARTHALPGDALLFSPAFSSHPTFTSVFDRCARFTDLIRSLQKREDARTLWDYLYIDQPLQKMDAVFAFGSNARRVAERAADLVLAGYADYLIVSGGNGAESSLTQPEADVFAEIALARGVPEDRIIRENRSSNTVENIQFVRALLAEHGYDLQRFILVQKPYATKRVAAAFEKQWPEATFIVTAPQVSFEEYARDEGEIDTLIHLLVGTVARLQVYAEQGYQAQQDIPQSVQEAHERLKELGYTGYLPGEALPNHKRMDREWGIRDK